MRTSVDPAWADGCTCHGAPTYWARDSRYAAGGYYRCSVDWLARQREDYQNWDHLKRARRNMAARRSHAVKRMRKRRTAEEV